MEISGAEVLKNMEEVLITTMDVVVGMDGKNAFEVWREQNVGGTYEQWLLYLQQPALDAAATVDEAIENAEIATAAADVATGNANTATTNANGAATNANTQAGIAAAQAAAALAAKQAADIAAAAADVAAGTANAAATNADNKALAAITATNAANAATLAADAATADAIAKTALAVTATTNANNAATAANNATTGAGTATTAANAAATNANDKAALAVAATTAANNAKAAADLATADAIAKTALAVSATTAATNAAADAVAKTALAVAATAAATTAAAQAKSDVTRSSNTPNTILTGAKTFVYTVESFNIGWAIGQRLRPFANSTNYMEGVVTAVNGTQVSLTIDRTVGSGNFSAWTISIAGETGLSGITTTNMATNRILGRYGAGAGTPQELTLVGSTLGADGNIYNGVDNGKIGGDLSKVVSVFNPLGGIYRGATANETGALRIKIPTGQNSQIYQISGKIFTSSNNGSCDFCITLWMGNLGNGQSATFIGANAVNYTVRIYSDGTDRYIYIGELSTIWNYVDLAITHVKSAYSYPSFSGASQGWEVTIQTSFTGTLQGTARTANLPQSNQQQVISDYVLGTDIAILNTDTKVQRDGKIQGQLNARYKKSEADARYLANSFTKAANNGYLIKTDIPAIGAVFSFFTAYLKGSGYSVNPPVNIQIQGYANNGAINQFKAISIGAYNFPITAFILDGVVHFWLPVMTTNVQLEINVFSPSATFGGKITPREILAITDVIKPTTGVTAEVTATQIKAIFTDPVYGNTVISGKLLLESGTNKASGIATLVAGTVLVSNTSCTVNSIIILTYKTPSGTIGRLAQGATYSEYFVINSLNTDRSINTADTSVVNWIIIN